jgi:short-subunit dehydrogenase
VDSKLSLPKLASNVHFFKCDITSTAAIASTANEIRSSIGEPTILINNAGVARGRTLLDLTESDIRLTFNVNTLAHIFMAQEFVPAMVAKNHGMIVTVASLAAYVSVSQMVDYGASKAAALSLHEGLTTELKTRYNAPRVRTVLVTQGYTKTPLFQGFTNNLHFAFPTLEPETVAEEIVAKMLEGRSGHIVLPETAGILLGLRSWASWLQSVARDRGKDSMREWHGQQVCCHNPIWRVLISGVLNNNAGDRSQRGNEGLISFDLRRRFAVQPGRAARWLLEGAPGSILLGLAPPPLLAASRVASEYHLSTSEKVLWYMV